MKKLNFGCGNDLKASTKQVKWDNCDIQIGKGVISFDANKFPYKKLKDNYYDYVLAREVLEFLNDPDKVLLELWKKVKPNGIIEVEVPYYNNKGSVNDFQVKHFFNDEVFRVFVKQPCVIDKKRRFKIVNITLKPTKPGSYIPKKIREKLALFLNGLISKVQVRLKVIKDN